MKTALDEMVNMYDDLKIENIKLKEKLKLHIDTLEEIVMSGHALKSIEQSEDMLAYVIKIAQKSLEDAGDIEV